MKTLELQDDSIAVVVKRGDVESKPYAVDLLELRLLVEELEEKHQLPIVDGRVQASRAFLRELAEGLQSMGVGDATPTVAAKLWQRLSEVVDALKKNTLEDAASLSSTESTPSS